MYRKAVLYKYSIRECSVHLERLADTTFKTSPKKKLMKLTSKGKLRLEVNWLPNSSSASMHFSEAVSTLSVYQKSNEIVPPGARKSVKCQRTKSMFENRPANYNERNSELRSKFNRPNFGLNPSNERILGPKPQQPLSDYEKMLEEYKKRVQSAKK